MKKIESLSQALNLFEQYSICRGNAINAGNAKVANCNYAKIENIVCFLREVKELSKLSIYYCHPNAFVKLDAAAYLLPIFEKESLKVMNEISKSEGIASLEAEMTIKEWKNGNLRNFYTL